MSGQRRRAGWAVRVADAGHGMAPPCRRQAQVVQHVL